jgi:hypothetical protein
LQILPNDATIALQFFSCAINNPNGISMSQSRPNLFKTKEKITWETLSSAYGELPAFSVKISPYKPSDKADEHLQQYERGTVHGVNVNISYGTGQRELSLTFLPTANNFDHGDKQCRLAIAKMSETSYDGDKIKRAYENYLRTAGIESALTVRVHKAPGMDSGSAF